MNSRAKEEFTVALPFSLPGKIVCALLGAVAVARPAMALTITPFFDTSITGAGNAVAEEGAINAAIVTIESLYSNSGTVGIVFAQSATILGQSDSADYTQSYAGYVSALTAVHLANLSNAILASAVNHLSTGNDANGALQIAATSAYFRVALGISASGCFASSGAFVSTCGQAYDGVVTIGNNLNDGPTPVAGQYSAIATAEHEINEILGGGGQGSTLGQSVSYFGPLDLDRYASAGTPSFTTAIGATAYLSVDGGVTNIVAFNQAASGDHADFAVAGYVQSAFGTPGTVPAYTSSSPDFAMMAAIGYNGVAVPEAGSLMLLGTAFAGLWAARRRPDRGITA